MKNHLEHRVPGSTVRAFHGYAGWIIELLHPDIRTNQDRIVSLLEAALANLPANVEKDIVWKVFLYADSAERFKSHGTLHTIPADNDLVTLAGDDCYLDLTEYDCEIISFNPYHGRQLIGRNSLTDGGIPILPYIPAARYLWLETMGSHYDIDNVSNSSLPNEIIVTLR